MKKVERQKNEMNKNFAVYKNISQQFTILQLTIMWIFTIK